MLEAIDTPADFALWRDFFGPARAAAPVIDMLAARGYNATLDYPACVMYKDLLAAYPAAKVLLTVRDTPEAFCKSINETIYKVWRGRPLVPFVLLALTARGRAAGRASGEARAVALDGLAGRHCVDRRRHVARDIPGHRR